MRTAAISFISLFAAVAYVGCISGTVSDDLSISEQVVLPGAGSLANDLADAGIPTPAPGSTFTLPVQQFSFDTSDAVSKLVKYGTVSVVVKSSKLSNTDLSFVSSVLVQMQPQDQSLPALTLSDFTTRSPSTSATIDLPTQNTDKVLPYLEKPETLSITMSVNASALPANDTAINYDLVLETQIKSTQTVSEIVKGN